MDGQTDVQTWSLRENIIQRHKMWFKKSKYIYRGDDQKILDRIIIQVISNLEWVFFFFIFTLHIMPLWGMTTIITLASVWPVSSGVCVMLVCPSLWPSVMTIAALLAYGNLAGRRLTPERWAHTTPDHRRMPHRGRQAPGRGSIRNLTALLTRCAEKLLVTSFTNMVWLLSQHG